MNISIYTYCLCKLYDQIYYQLFRLNCTFTKVLTAIMAMSGWLLA